MSNVSLVTDNTLIEDNWPEALFTTYLYDWDYWQRQELLAVLRILENWDSNYNVCFGLQSLMEIN